MLECDDDRASAAAGSRRRWISSGSGSAREVHPRALYARRWPVVWRSGPRRRPPIRARAGRVVREAMRPRIDRGKSREARCSGRSRSDVLRGAGDERRAGYGRSAGARRRARSSTHRANNVRWCRTPPRVPAHSCPRSHRRTARWPPCRTARARTSRAQSRTRADDVFSGERGQPLRES